MGTGTLKLGLNNAIAICFHDIPEGRLQSRHYIKLENESSRVWSIVYPT